MSDPPSTKSMHVSSRHHRPSPRIAPGFPTIKSQTLRRSLHPKEGKLCNRNGITQTEGWTCQTQPLSEASALHHHRSEASNEVVLGSQLDSGALQLESSRPRGGLGVVHEWNAGAGVLKDSIGL